MKQLVTERKVDVEAKFKDTKHYENVADFIIVSNSFAPVRLTETDRKFMVTDVSSERRLDTNFFINLAKGLNEDFYRNLLTYFLSIDLSNWDKTRIPKTQLKQDIIEFSKSPYAQFIQDNVNRFKKGFIKQEAFIEYKKWCEKKDIIKPGSQYDFRLGILKFCRDYKPNSKNGSTRPSYYKLRSEAYVYFKIEPEIIEVQ